jgi:hypothetical protein
VAPGVIQLLIPGNGTTQVNYVTNLTLGIWRIPIKPSMPLF